MNKSCLRTGLLAVALALAWSPVAWAQYQPPPRAAVVRPLDVRPLPARAYWAQALLLTVPNNYYGPNVYYYPQPYYYQPWYGNNYSPQSGWTYYGAPDQYGNSMPSVGVTVEQR
jgi:hypothetical protein